MSYIKTITSYLEMGHLFRMPKLGEIFCTFLRSCIRPRSWIILQSKISGTLSLSCLHNCLSYSSKSGDMTTKFIHTNTSLKKKWESLLLKAAAYFQNSTMIIMKRCSIPLFLNVQAYFKYSMTPFLWFFSKWFISLFPCPVGLIFSQAFSVLAKTRSVGQEEIAQKSCNFT